MEPEKLTMLLLKICWITKLESRMRCSQSLDIDSQGFGLAMHVDSCYAAGMLVL